MYFSSYLKLIDSMELLSSSRGISCIALNKRVPNDIGHLVICCKEYNLPQLERYLIRYEGYTTLKGKERPGRSRCECRGNAKNDLRPMIKHRTLVNGRKRIILYSCSSDVYRLEDDTLVVCTHVRRFLSNTYKHECPQRADRAPFISMLNLMAYLI